jgi:hypothetical protein
MTTDRAGPEGTIGRETACLCPVRRTEYGFKCGEPHCDDLNAHIRKARDHIANLSWLEARLGPRKTCGLSQSRA